MRGAAATILGLIAAGAGLTIGTVVGVTLLWLVVEHGSSGVVVTSLLASLLGAIGLTMAGAALAGWWVATAVLESSKGVGGRSRSSVLAFGVLMAVATVMAGPLLYLVPVGSQALFCGRPNDPVGTIAVTDVGRRITCTPYAFPVDASQSRVLDLRASWWAAFLVVASAPVVGVAVTVVGVRTVANEQGT